MAARCESFEEDTPTLVNFNGQITSAITELLEANNIHVVLLPPSTTDFLQPMDMSVNKPEKDFLNRHFEDWYAGEVMKQLDGKEDEATEIQPWSTHAKEARSQVAGSDGRALCRQLQIIVNGFIRAGIASALDHVSNEPEDTQDEDDTESDFGVSDEAEQSDYDDTVVEIEDN